jgi:hypothetical protein
MRSLYLQLAVIGCLAFTASGCATLTKSQLAEVRLDSSPQHVQVLVNGYAQGTTPLTLSIERNKNHNVTFMIPGQLPIHVQISPKLDVMTTIMGNLVSWNIVGIVVDLVTGHAYTLTPADIEQNFDYISKYATLDSSKNGAHLFIVSQSDWNKISTTD